MNYSNVAAPAGTVASIKVGDKVITSFDKGKAGATAAAQEKAFNDAATAAIRAAGYPAAADPAKVNTPIVILILTILVLYVTMVYGPIAAMLVELFPTRIRYSGMSLPYHIGNGWFGGFLPPTAFAIVAATGNIYSGLWYPIVDRRHDLRHRPALHAGDQGPRHLQGRLTAASCGRQTAAPQGAAVFSGGAPLQWRVMFSGPRASRSLMILSERDARGPEEHEEKTRHWSGAPPAKDFRSVRSSGTSADGPSAGAAGCWRRSRPAGGGCRAGR